MRPAPTHPSSRTLDFSVAALTNPHGLRGFKTTHMHPGGPESEMGLTGLESRWRQLFLLEAPGRVFLASPSWTSSPVTSSPNSSTSLLWREISLCLLLIRTLVTDYLEGPPG